MGTSTYRFRQRPGRFTIVLVVAMLPVLGVGIFSLTQVLNDPELTGGELWALGVTVIGGLLVLPLVVMALHIAVRVTGDQVRVQLWPVPSTRIALGSIRSVEMVRTEPLGEYQGLGLKGSREDRLLGFEGTDAVRIEYDRRARAGRPSTPRRLTILTPQAERLAADLEARLAEHR